MQDSRSLPVFLQTLGAIFIPDLPQAVASFLAALLTYFVISANYYWNVITGGQIVTLDAYTSTTVREAFAKVSTLPGTSTLAISALWGCLGIAVYVIVLSIINFFVTTRNNQIMNSPYANKPRLLAFAVINEYRRIIWMVLLATLVVATATIFLPFWLASFYIFTNEHTSILLFAASLIGLTYNLYLLFSCSVAVIRNPKILS